MAQKCPYKVNIKRSKSRVIALLSLLIRNHVVMGSQVFGTMRAIVLGGTIKPPVNTGSQLESNASNQLTA